MPINYTIRADVINIRTDTPIAEDVFLVDTNIWFWMTYPYATYIRSEYSTYLNDALAKNSKIHHSGISLAELSHTIEKTEHEIYVKAFGDIEPKEYRNNLTSERTNVVSQIQAAWSQVTNLAMPLPITIDNTTTTSALNRLQNTVDGYDLFILESMANNGVVQIITDDGDYATVPSIQVFTANQNVIRAARTQGKLIAR